MDMSPTEWLFYITLVLVTGLFAYGLYESRTHKDFLSSLESDEKGER